MWGLLVPLSLFTSGVLAEVPTAKCPFDESFDNCFKDFIIKTIPTVASHGIPEVSIPPLDPFKVPNLKAKFNAVMAQGAIEVTDTIVKGIVGTNIIKFQTNIGKFNLQNFVVAEVSVHIPHVTVEGNWRGGSLVVMDMKVAESGKFNLAVDDIKVTLVAEGTLQKLNASFYFPELTKLIVYKPEIEKVKIDASDPIKGNPQQSKSVISLANTFWRALYEEIFPVVTQQIETLGYQYINSYTKQYMPLKGSEIEKMLQKNQY